jgi:hypothetical protein
MTMKTKFIFRIGTAMLMLLSVRSSFAQQVAKNDTLPTIYIYSTSIVNKTVHQAFKRDFYDATTPKWYAMDENYLVKFISKDQKNHALYNTKGYLIYHLTYVNAVELPKNIQGDLNSQYADGIALTAIHVDQDTRSIWVVNLKVGEYFVVARVEDDQVEEIQRFTDASI